MENLQHSDDLPASWIMEHRSRYEQETAEIRKAFDANARSLHAGTAAIAARSAAVDRLVQSLWDELLSLEVSLKTDIVLMAVGGYGRRELFPHSDVDLMFLLHPRVSERSMKEAIRRLSQLLWDAGLRISAMTRSLTECERFDPENVEFTLSLLDARFLAGEQALAAHLIEKSVPKLLSREARQITARLLDVTRTRHARYGDTLFHLEPNLKECPGGLRDAHVCEWLSRLARAGDPEARGAELRNDAAFAEAREFLLLTRTFLHFRHGRDDNTLDWLAQDAAAGAALGTGILPSGPVINAAYWMRLYFRQARSIKRCVSQFLGEPASPRASKFRVLRLSGRKTPDEARTGFEVRHNQLWLGPATLERAADPANDPDIVLNLFASVAATGVGLALETERRVEQALPLLSTHLEDGPMLWRRLQAILTGSFAGAALRSMHALGILELVLPEFHGIDALVIRDAYHRYTVDEHTFVLIDTLHGLGAEKKPTTRTAAPGLAPWAARFGVLFRDLPHPELLLLASLLHDTGKGHAATGHAAESARMAAGVMKRLELDAYETTLVCELIRNHLEMSAALRRDVFDQETIRSFAVRVPNPEALRMLTLFTYADIAAVHPDALTPWKAENLYRLHNATLAYLDRNVDDERVAAEASTELSELVHRVHALLPQARAQVNSYLEGFPQRYLQTRNPEVIRTHVQLASRLSATARMEIDFHYAPTVSEITLITEDRPKLFASIAGTLAGWGMNIITADAFSNAQGIVVDSFRFTDTFRTLELNDSERDRFVQSVRDVASGHANLEALLNSRRKARRKKAKTQVDSRLDFNDSASSHSTLLQVVAQDTPGLLHALALTLADQDCNIEVALVDTEGETAIDVFYLTHSGGKLELPKQQELQSALKLAIEQNASAIRDLLLPDARPTQAENAKLTSD